MENKLTTVTLIERLAKHEELLKSLYELYGKVLESHAYFWHELAGEEQQHADMLRCLKGKVKKGEVEFDLGHYDMESIYTSELYIKQQISISREKKDMVDALETALMAESNTVDVISAELLEQPAEVTREVFGTLRKETVHHSVKIKVLLDSLQDKKRFLGLF